MSRGACRSLSVVVNDVLNVENREHETKAWNKAGYGKAADGDRLLLWHGSRTTNFAGILKQGLRIAPPEGESWVLDVFYKAHTDVVASSRHWLHVRQGCLLRRCMSILGSLPYACLLTVSPRR